MPLRRLITVGPGLLLTLGLLCCGGLPALQPEDISSRPALRRACAAVFPAGSWSLVHVMEVSLPLGQTSSIIGVSTLDAGEKSLHSALLSPEGITLFDATYQGGRLTVRRALPPLDREGFAAGLFRDVRLMFIQPAGEPHKLGRLERGGRACRWTLPGGARDIIILGDGGWRIRDYDQGGALQREVRAHPPLSRGFAKKVKLVKKGSLGYSMHLELLEATPWPSPPRR